MSTEGRVSLAAREAFGHLVEKLASSAVVVMLAPRGRPDYKIALELGAALFLDKPIILVIPPGEPVPDRLRAVATVILNAADVTTPKGQEQVAAAIAHLVGELE